MLSRWLYIVSIAFSLTLPGVAWSAVIDVDCDLGDSLAAAVEAANPGDTIHVSGTCNENVTIRTDDLTLNGQDTAIVDGGGSGIVVTVDGARNLAMADLTIRNGSGGILVVNDATLAVTDLIVTGSRSHGIEVIHSTIHATRLTSEQNGRVGLIVNRNSLAEVTDASLRFNLSGLVVYSNAVVRFFGTNDMSHSTGQGMTAGLGGAIFSIGPTLLMNNNGAEGLFVSQQGNVQAIGGVLEANRNASDGIRVDQNASLSLGVPGLGGEPTVGTNDNGGHGVSVQRGSHLLVTGGLTSSGNAVAGIALDDASNATLDGVTASSNGAAGLWIDFGSQVTLGDGNNLESIFCDRNTVLVRGGKCTNQIAPSGKRRLHR